jgi:hypothetical protein
MKQIRLTSRYYVLRCGFKVQVLYEGALIKFRPSGILEEWYDIFYNDVYSATIPASELKENFIIDNLLLA